MRSASNIVIPCQDFVDETENRDQGISVLEEYQPDPTDSPSSQVQTYECRAVESGFIEQLNTSRETGVGFVWNHRSSNCKPSRCLS